MSEAILRALFLQSAAGAGLILVMMVLRRMFLNKVPHRLIYGLWLMVAVRLLLPAELPNPVALDIGQPPSIVTARIVEAGVHAPAVLESEPSVAAPAVASQAVAAAVEENASTKTEAPKAASRNPQSLAPLRLTASDLLLGLWLAGTMFMAAYTVIVNRRWTRRATAGAKVLDTGAPIPVLLGNVSSPCLIGVFRPRILINKIGERPENLPFVLKHELGHYHGLDHVWNLASKILLALFWFHPLVWAAEALRKRDCERACDERVTSSLGKGEAAAYARTLIALVSPEKVRFVPAAAMMATTLADMKQRVSWVLARKQVRRWACALLCGLILLTTAASFATGERPVREITLPEKFKAQPFYYPTNSGLWLGLNGHLYRQTEEDTFAEVAAASSGPIAADASAVYTLTQETNEIVMLDHAGVKSKAWVLPKELSPFKLETAGGKLAILSGEPMDWRHDRRATENTLYLMDMQTGNLTEMKLGNVTDVSSDGAGSLVVLHTPVTSTYEALVTRLNPNSLSTATITTADPQALCIAAESGALYMLTWSRLEKFDEQTATLTVINLPMEMPGERLQGMRVAKGMMYAWDTMENRLLSVDVSENRDQGETVLTIINFGYAGRAFDSAKEAFLKRHPEVRFRDVEMNPDQYATALMAGDTEIDILFEVSAALSDFARAGALVPLSDEPAVMEALDMAEWLPFQEIYSYQGKLYGVPGYIFYNLFSVNASLARQTGFVMPKTPYTWRDLYEAASAAGLGQPGRPTLMYESLWRPHFLYNYVAAQAKWEGRLNFDTPGFREDMRALKQMAEENIIVLADAGEKFPDAAPMLEAFAEISDDAVMPPAVNGREAAMMQSYGLFVNAKSQNRALAVEFLAEYVKPEHQYKNDYGDATSMMLTDENQYDRTWYDDPRSGIQRYTQYKEELRMHTAGKWVTWNKNLHWGSVLDETGALPKYLDGSITLDEFIRIIQEKVDMMQYE